jgi:hypothetical protein
VNKVIVNETAAPIANFPMTTFTATVSCSPTSLVNQGSLPLTVFSQPSWGVGPFNALQSQPSNVVVPVGDNCTVKEVPPTTPPPPYAVPVAACPSGFATWGPPTILWGPPLPPATPLPANIQTAGQTYTVNMTNPLVCASGGGGGGRQ